jgi:hypothetical protein
MQVVDFPATDVVLAGKEVVDHFRLERTGTKQGDERDQVIEMFRLHAFDQFAHAA